MGAMELKLDFTHMYDLVGRDDREFGWGKQST